MIIQKGSQFFVDTHTAKYSPWILQAMERDNFRCVKCNETDVSKLIVHHIDESRRKFGSYAMNNSLSNLITLCRPCHAKEHKQTIVSDKLDKIKELLLKYMTYSQIGKEIGISRQRVHQIVKKSIP